MKQKMTKEEFLDSYFRDDTAAEREEFLQEMVPLPCGCNWPDCKGWAMVQNTERAIARHNAMYAPDKD